MPDKSLPDADLNLAVLDATTVTHSSADRSAEKSKRTAQIAGHLKGGTATADEPDHIERKK